jgi:hypothetical protein
MTLDRKTVLIVLPFLIALIFIAIFVKWIRWDGIALSVDITKFAGLLAPLAFGAAVVERAVEIIVSPWRDTEANKRKNAIVEISARPVDPANPNKNAADLKVAKDSLDDYQGETQKFAFAISITLSFFIAIAGIRAFDPFLDSIKFRDIKITSLAQQIFFVTVDVGISAALLAGGADGIHSVVSAVTRFFDNTNKTK